MPNNRLLLGELVIYYQGDHEAPGSYAGQPHRWAGTNGERFHPALITRRWSDDCANVIIFFDAEPLPKSKTSMCRLPASVFAEGVHCTNSGWLHVEDYEQIMAERAARRHHAEAAAPSPEPTEGSQRPADSEPGADPGDPATEGDSHDGHTTADAGTDPAYPINGGGLGSEV